MLAVVPCFVLLLCLPKSGWQRTTCNALIASRVERGVWCVLLSAWAHEGHHSKKDTAAPCVQTRGWVGVPGGLFQSSSRFGIDGPRSIDRSVICGSWIFAATDRFRRRRPCFVVVLFPHSQTRPKHTTLKQITPICKDARAEPARPPRPRGRLHHAPRPEAGACGRSCSTLEAPSATHTDVSCTHAQA